MLVLCIWYEGQIIGPFPRNLRYITTSGFLSLLNMFAHTDLHLVCRILPIEIEKSRSRIYGHSVHKIKGHTNYNGRF